jgi:hypothetical protein
MPKVEVRTKSVRGDYKCGKCGDAINPGTVYYTWSFRYGGTHRRHFECGRPRPSELTQSRMSDVYAAQEAFQDLGTEASYEDQAAAVQDLIDTVTEVAGEYEAAAEPFGNSGENQERYEMLEGWVTDLEDAHGKLEAAAEAISEVEGAVDIVNECPL